jgi:cyclohexanone monooxygenase
MEAEADAVERYVNEVDQQLGETLMREGDSARSWFVGANIPGKPHKPLFYLAGIPAYRDECQRVLDADLDGFALGVRTHVG